MQWLGHQDSAMVRHYDHLNGVESRQQMDRPTIAGGADNHVASSRQPRTYRRFHIRQ
jgi:hypothetical protein